MNLSASMKLPHQSQDTEQSKSRETVPGGASEERWVPVLKTSGLVNAQIVADSLLSVGIPARAWQEGAGQAIGLTVGILGTGYVMVPESMKEQAQEYLESMEDGELEE